MLRGLLATLGLLIALGLSACDEPSDGQMPPAQEPTPGTTPPATQ